MPCDEAQRVHSDVAGAGLEGGRNAGGGSHSSAIGRRGGGCGGSSSQLPPSRPEPSKSLRMHLVPPGRVPSPLVASMVANSMPAADRSRPPPPTRWGLGSPSRGGARARPISAGEGAPCRCPGRASAAPSRQPDGPCRRRRRRRLARGACTPNAEWPLEQRAAPVCIRSRPWRPCARRTQVLNCGSSPGTGSPVCGPSGFLPTYDVVGQTYDVV